MFECSGTEEDDPLLVTQLVRRSTRHFHICRNSILQKGEKRKKKRTRLELTRICLTNQLRSHGLALSVVRVEQRRPGDATRDVRDLPGEVIRILDARVAAEAVGRRVAVGGVAEEEGPRRGRAAVGEGLAQHPGVDALHLDRDGAHERVRVSRAAAVVAVEAEGLADAGEQLGRVGREGPEGVRLGGHGARDDGDEHPFAPGAHDAEDCLGGGSTVAISC